MCGCVCRARDSPPMRSYRRRADCPFGGGDDSRRRWLDNFSFDKRHADNDYDDDKIIITRKKRTLKKISFSRTKSTRRANVAFAMTLT